MMTFIQRIASRAFLSIVMPAVISLGVVSGSMSANAATSVKKVNVLTTPSYIPAPPTIGSDEYRCFVLDPKIAKSSFLQSVLIAPNNPSVSHHGILYRLTAANTVAAKTLDAQTTEPGWSCFGDTGIPGAEAFGAAPSSSWISFWAPGGNFKQFPAGTGMSMSAGDKFILQVHYHVMTGMKASSATMNVTLKYATTSVKQLKTFLLAAPIELACLESESGPLCNRDAAIADLAKRTSDKSLFTGAGLTLSCGGDISNPVANPISTCTQRLRSPVTIYGSTGHMHQLGKTITITLQDGVSGEITTLTSQSQWNFDNQKTDWVAKPLAAKAGDKLKVSCTYDLQLRSLLPEFKNQPPRYVVWGEGSTDEMCLAIVNYAD
jgi:hypothetical protein